MWVLYDWVRCAILKSAIGPIANASGSISQHLRTITSIDAIKRFAMRSFALLCTQCNELGIAFCNMLIVQYRCSIHSVQYSLVVETIGHVCFVPLVTNLFPLFHLLIIMPSSDISSLCHIHRNGSATRAFNKCYHNESLCSWIFTTWHTATTEVSVRGKTQRLPRLILFKEQKTLTETQAWQCQSKPDLTH